ncbi:MAG: zf-HC2 domain-containing protein [Ktedonobacterales bacterium]
MYGSHDDGGMRGADELSGPPEQCAAVALQLAAFHDGMLPPDDVRVVASHVAACTRCAARLAALAEADQLIRAAPAPLAGPELRDRLYGRIAAARRAGQPHAPIYSNSEMMTMNDTESSLLAATRRSPRRLSVWVSSIAAALIVALLAGVFLMAHGSGHAPRVGAGGTATATTGACAPSAIKTNLPANAYLTDTAMTSPIEGWAVGGIQNSDSSWAKSLILHYSHCQWTQAGPVIPNTGLQSISMDSPSDGWITGSTYSTNRVLLHYTGDQWHQVSDPVAGNVPVTFMQIRMLSPTEGWLVASGAKDAKGVSSDWLLHYHNGVWTEVDMPISETAITDISPVGSDDLWVACDPAGPDLRGGILAHYVAGKWTIAYHAPGNILLNSVRMFSPTDGWATGEAFPPANSSDPTGQANYFEGGATPAILHYDGTAWKGVNPGSSANAQRVSIFGAGEGWAFQVSHRADDANFTNLTISLAQYESGGTWQTVKMPANDLNGILGLSRVSAGEYWAIGSYEVYTQTPDQSGGVSGAGYNKTVLLHFANGAWTQYGR